MQEQVREQVQVWVEEQVQVRVRWGAGAGASKGEWPATHVKAASDSVGCHSCGYPWVHPGGGTLRGSAPPQSPGGTPGSGRGSES